MLLHISIAVHSLEEDKRRGAVVDTLTQEVIIRIYVPCENSSSYALKKYTLLFLYVMFQSKVVTLKMPAWWLFAIICYSLHNFTKYKISNGLCKSIHVAPLLTFCNQTCKWPLNGPRLLDLYLFFKCLLEGKMPSKLLFTFFRDQKQPLLKVFLFQKYLKYDFP